MVAHVPIALLANTKALLDKPLVTLAPLAVILVKVLPLALLVHLDVTPVEVMRHLALLVQLVLTVPVLQLAVLIALRVGIKALLARLPVMLVVRADIQVLVPAAAPTAPLVTSAQALLRLRVQLVRQAATVLVPLLAIVFLPVTTKVAPVKAPTTFAPLALTALVAPQILLRALLAVLVQQDLAKPPLVLLVDILLPVVLALLVPLGIIQVLVLLHAQYVVRVGFPI